METNHVSQKVEHFFSQYQKLHFLPNQVILSPQMKSEGIFYLQQGHVKQYMLSPTGNELVVNIYKPGSYFPMQLALNASKNAYYFMTLDNVVIHQAPVQKVIGFLQINSDVQFDLLKRTYIGIDGLLQQLVFCAVSDTRKKIIACLVMAAKRFGELNKSGLTQIGYRFTHKQLAALSGTSRESVTRVLPQLEAEGLITVEKRTILIPELAKLERELSL